MSSASPRTPALLALAALAIVSLTSCQTKQGIVTTSTGNLYEARATHTEVGVASWYGGRWVGRLTANGETYLPGDMTAAHKKLPFNSMVRVTNLRNGKSALVRINNRGPFIRGRIIDLSVPAAKKIGMYEGGLAKVKLEVLKPIPVMTEPNLTAATRTPKKLTREEAEEIRRQLERTLLASSEGGSTQL